MSLRGFGGIQNLPASSIPVYGTTLTAAAVINPDQFTGQITPGSNRSSAVLSVAVANRFRVGDRVAIGTAVQFEQGNTVQADGGTVVAVSIPNGTITVQGLQRAHASGEYVVLALAVASLSIQVVTASNTAYIGEDPTVGQFSTTLIDEVTTGGIFSYGISNIANVLETQHLWIGGGPGVQFIPSFLTI
jgi:hypothetical protein